MFLLQTSDETHQRFAHHVFFTIHRRNSRFIRDLFIKFVQTIDKIDFLWRPFVAIRKFFLCPNFRTDHRFFQNFGITLDPTIEWRFPQKNFVIFFLATVWPNFGIFSCSQLVKFADFYCDRLKNFSIFPVPQIDKFHDFFFPTTYWCFSGFYFLRLVDIFRHFFPVAEKGNVFALTSARGKKKSEMRIAHFLLPGICLYSLTSHSD